MTTDNTNPHPRRRRSLRDLLLTAVTTAMILCGVSACVDLPDYATAPKDDPYANFDALADIIDTRYCFFAEKDIDWDKVCAENRKKVTPDMNQGDLFFLLADMLDTLRDGHVNLVSSFNTSYYKKWWSDYPQDFNERTLQQYYLKFGGMQTSGIQYVIFMPDSIGYMRYPSFTATVSETGLDYVLSVLSKTRGLIIDVRDNGGGDLTNISTLVSRFIDSKRIGGYISHKTGPGHDDFSEPYAVEYEPCSPKRVSYTKPIAVLTNRSSFSSANDFVAVMKELPQVKIVGARTGGGGGLPFSSELPNGWGIRFSASPMTDARGVSIEDGISPSPGCEVHCSDEELAAGRDAILNFAIRMLAGKQTPDVSSPL